MKLMTIGLVLAAVTRCTTEEVVVAPIGQPPQYVCLRQLPLSGACLRSEWRCSAPLQLHSIDGRPRCVMPGGE